MAGSPGEVRASAVEFLLAVRAGDDVALELATRLAETLLEASGARLALQVLEGGALSVTRAIRLAEHVLAAVAADEGVEATAGAS